MFAETLSVTYGGVSKSFVRVNQDAYSSEYRFQDTTQRITLFIRHSTVKGTKKERHNVEFQQVVFGATEAEDIARKAYCVYEISSRDTSADLLETLRVFLGGTGFQAKLVGGES